MIRLGARFKLLFVAAVWLPASFGFAQDIAGFSRVLDRVKARQVLYVGYREAALPFSYLVPGQTAPVGYVWDVCSHVFKAVDARLGKTIPIVPVSVTENARGMMLKTGVVDLDCGAAANTVSKLNQVDFSTNIYINDIRVLVKKGSGLNDFAQLAGKRMVVVAGDTGERYAKMAALGHNISLQYLQANDPAEAMLMLAKGEADAYVAEDAELVVQRAVTPGDFVLLDAVLATEPLGIMLPKDDAVWKKLVDETIVGLMKSGELARIYDKWFLNPIPPAGINLNLPMSQLLKTAIQVPGDTAVN